jgi:HEAT repeat protein
MEARLAKLASSSLLKAVQMSTRGFYLAVFLLVLGCQQSGVGQNQSSEPSETVITKTEPNAQLQLYTEALTDKGSSDRMRLNAANLLLFSKEPAARAILLDTLSKTLNGGSRIAICKALSRARQNSRAVRQSEDFIAPLLEVLRTEQDVRVAELAAEALLIFDYEEISEPLEKIAIDTVEPVQARLNAIFALSLHPDKGAVFALMKLVDDEEKLVALAAQSSLETLDVFVGKDAALRRQVTEELQRRADIDFLRNRVILLELARRQSDTKLAAWKMRYLEALDKIYEGLTEDSLKGEFLAKHLIDSETIVKSWALDKVREDVLSTNPLPSTELFGPTLLELISFPNKDVRLKTAKLLSLMGAVNSADKLLIQLKAEEDEQVRIEVFVALGNACWRGLSPDSQTKVSAAIRKEALEWAATYLGHANVVESQRGAEVMRKLLERNDLESEVGKYLDLLAERYGQEKGTSDGVLRGELLSRMAGLCAQASACRLEAGNRFEPMFEAALSDEVELVRAAAVSGLIRIDKVQALARFRKSDLINDASVEISNKLAGLAGEIGVEADLVWLWNKASAGPAGDPAWEAMLKVFKRSDVSVLVKWMNKLDSLGPEGGFSDERMVSFLETAEQKSAENGGGMLRVIWQKLASVYKKDGKFAQAESYLEKLRQDVGAESKREVLSELLDLYLRWPRVEKAAGIIDNFLSVSDLGADSSVVILIERYISDPPAGVDSNEVLGGIIGRIRAVGDRPEWEKQVKRWNNSLGKGKEVLTGGEAEG